MRYIRCALIALWVLALAEPDARPQNPTCTDLEGVPGAMGYQHRSDPARCEGLYQSPVAGESLVLLSLVNRDISYDLKTDKILTLAVPDVTALGASEVSVRARALPLLPYYRMDTSVASAQALEWPLQTVIGRVGLPADNIGVFGWIEKEGTQTFVPVSVFPKGKTPASVDHVIAIFRSTVDIQKVEWRLLAPGATDLSWQVLGGNTPSRVQAGDPIKLSMAKSGHVLSLEVAAKMANSDDWLKIRLRVYVP